MNSCRYFDAKSIFLLTLFFIFLFTVLAWFVEYLRHIVLLQLHFCLLQSLKYEHASDEWRLFTDVNKASLTSVLPSGFCFSLMCYGYMLF